MLSGRVTDQAGTVLPYTSVLILEADGTTPLAQTLYVAPTGGAVRTNPLTTDSLGMLIAYAETPQRAVARVGSGDAAVFTVIDIEDDPADTLSAPIPLANLAVPTSGYVLQSNGSAVVGGLVVNANIDAAAAIAHSKLASTTQHYVLRAAGGGTIGAGLLTADNLTDATITAAKMAATAWTGFTPTLTQSGAVAVTVNYARYRVVGKVVYLQVLLTVTGTGTTNNAIVIGALPAAIAPLQTGATRCIGTALIGDNSAGTHYLAAILPITASTLQFIVSGQSNYLGVTPNYAIDNNDTISFSVTYELA